MPTGVQAIETLVTSGQPDGFRIISRRGTWQLKRANIPATVRNKTPAEVEAWINNWLAANIADVSWFVAVHVASVNPLVASVICSNDPISGDWWL